MLVWTLGTYVFAKDDATQYLGIMAVSTFLGMLFLVSFFYTYSGVLGRNISWIDIGSFFLTVTLIFVLSCFWLKKAENQPLQKVVFSNCTGWILWIVLFFLFCYFTWHAPDIGIFQEP